MENKEQQRFIDKILSFNLFDDTFMKAFFKGNKKATELMLRIILKKKDLTVKSVDTQSYMKNLQGRDVILDIVASDSKGITYNIEIQKSDKGAEPKRARYHSSILDSNLLSPGQDFDDLPETFVIFITENDYLGRGEPLYLIERRYEDNNEFFEDGEHIIYVNGTNKDSSMELGKLMHDFSCSEPDDMNYKVLAERARYLKKTKKGMDTMGWSIAEIKQEATDERNEEIAMNLIKLGKITLEDIAEETDLPVEKIRELAGEKAV